MHVTKEQAEAAFRDWGLTNDPIWKERASAFREAAIADGWRPTDDTGEHFMKDGYAMHVLSRDEGPEHHGLYRYHTSVAIWGPDGMAIAPPNLYDWKTIQAGITTCNYCGKKGIEPQRVSFAGRCCIECLPGLRDSLERPGWDR